MTLDMRGTVSGCFVSTVGTKTETSGAFDSDGIWVENLPVVSTHNVNIQPLTDREIKAAALDVTRLSDYRKIYVNDGLPYDVSPKQLWSFVGLSGSYEAIQIDNRPWRNYCKIIVSRLDDT